MRQMILLRSEGVIAGPRSGLKRAPRGLHGGIDIRLVAFGHAGDDVARSPDS